MKEYCQNCGHICHCKGYCLQVFGEKNETVCCTQSRHKENEEKIEDITALFNGA